MDIGFDDCRFLSLFFSDNNWKFYGIELNPACYTLSREKLGDANRVLDNKGVFIAGIPNIKSLGFKVGKKHWFHLDAPRHLYHYDHITINKILNKNGFEVIKIIYPLSTYPLDLYHCLLNKFGKID